MCLVMYPPRTVQLLQSRSTQPTYWIIADYCLALGNGRIYRLSKINVMSPVISEKGYRRCIGGVLTNLGYMTQHLDVGSNPPTLTRRQNLQGNTIHTRAAMDTL